MKGRRSCPDRDSAPGPSASTQYVSNTGEPGYFDPSVGRRFLQHEMSHRRIVDLGDADIIPTNVAGTFDNITALVARALSRGGTPIVLGGDHAISYPVVRAFSEPLYVIHFDAHLDYMPFVHGHP